MSVINEEVFCKIALNQKDSNWSTLASSMASVTNYQINMPGAPVDREAAIVLLNQVKEYAKRNGYYASKSLRPYWFDHFEYLNRAEPWWGFEFETGYLTSALRSEAIEAAVNVAENGVTFDAEGEGGYYSEITFSPAEQSKYLDKSAPAYRFIQWLNDHPEHVNRTSATMIGTHLNASWPDADVNKLARIAWILNNSIHLLPPKMDETQDTRKVMFGRSSLYMGCHVPDGEWIEMKLFRTAYTTEEFDNYIKTAKALTKIGTWLLANRPDLLDYMSSSAAPVMCGVSNLLEMWNDDTIEPVLIESADLHGVYHNYYISGNAYDPDQW